MTVASSTVYQISGILPSIELYASAYGDSGLTAQEVPEEIICDAEGQMNAFATEETERAAGEVGLFLCNVRKAAKDTGATKNTTGDGGVTYYSREIEYDPETAGIKDQIRNSASILNEMEPVANLSVPENLNNKRNAEEWAIDILRRTGYKVERKGDGVIYFEEKDIRKAMNYCDTKAEKAAMAAVPMVLKRGIIIGAHDNHKNREKSTITFAGPVVLNGIRGNMGVVVNRRGNHYYTHRIIMPDGSAFVFKNKNDATQEPYRGVTTKGSLASTTSAASTDKVTQPEKKVKQKYSREMQSMEELRRVNRALERKLETVQRQAAREIQNAKESHGITRMPTANRDDVAAVARRLLRDYGSKSKQWFIREELQKIVDAIIGDPNADFSALRDQAKGIADNILQGASYDINWDLADIKKEPKESPMHKKGCSLEPY